jgi:hypothetical protein
LQRIVSGFALLEKPNGCRNPLTRKKTVNRKS